MSSSAKAAISETHMSESSNSVHAGVGQTVSTSHSDMTQTQTYPRDINIVDVFCVLVRYARRATIVFLLIVLAGVALVLSQPQDYGFKTQLRIGQVPSFGGTGELVLIESTEDVLDYTDNILIREAELQLREKYADQSAGSLLRIKDFGLDLSASGEIVTITTIGPLADKEKHQTLHTILAADIIDMHRPEYDHQMTKVSNSLARLELDLNNLSGASTGVILSEAIYQERVRSLGQSIEDKQRQIEETKKSIQRIDAMIKLASEDFVRTREMVTTAMAQRSDILSQGQDTIQVVALLTIDSEIRSHDQQIATLRQRIEIDLPAQKEALESKIISLQKDIKSLNVELNNLELEHQKTIADRGEKISRLQLQKTETEGLVDRSQMTVALKQFQQSDEPVGAKPASKIILFVLLALIFAGVTPLISEILRQMKQILSAAKEIEQTRKA